MYLDTFCALTRSTTSVASGVLLVLGGMSRGAGRTHSDWDGMFLMNLKLNKRIKTVRIKKTEKQLGCYQTTRLENLIWGVHVCLHYMLYINLRDAATFTLITSCVDTVQSKCARGARISMRWACDNAWMWSGACSRPLHLRIEGVFLLVSAQQVNGTVTKHALFRTHQHTSSLC